MAGTGRRRRWLNTGDLGRQDADGYFYLTGRKKELIIRGGHNIDPASIEEPLHRHPAVQTRRRGRPARRARRRAAGGLRAAQARRLRDDRRDAAVLRQGPDHRTRRNAEGDPAVPAMPLTGVGKIFKPELKHREIEIH